MTMGVKASEKFWTGRLRVARVIRTRSPDCILLAAGTNVLPHKFRVNEYKLWMRSLLVLWWLVRLLGLATYGRREEMFDLFCNY
jgi:hypothetical protein